MGGSASGNNTSKSLINFGQGFANTSLAGGTANINQGTSLLQPGIQYNQSMASGDQTKMTQAAAPLLTNIADQASTARQDIYNSAPAGAARTFALSSLARGVGTQNAGAMNNAYTQSFGNLSNYGQQLNSLGLQQQGAALSGAGLSSQTNLGQQQSNNQAKAATTNAFAGLAGSLVPAKW
jgi:superoxide dismutase